MTEYHAARDQSRQWEETWRKVLFDAHSDDVRGCPCFDRDRNRRRRIMLFGIDSVIRKQTCTIDGKTWQCWPAAVRDLQTHVNQGPAICDTIGEPDVYSRVLALCTIDGRSLNEKPSDEGTRLHGRAKQRTMSPHKRPQK
jgi:hypothetical protein